MQNHNQIKMKHSCCYFIIIALLICFLPYKLNAQDRETQRIWAGLDLFPSMLAADQDIASKTGPDGKLLLILKYINDKGAAEEMARHLKKVNTIRGIPIRIELSNHNSLENYKDTQIAGVFIAQKLTDSPSDIIHFGKKQHAIIFSPFKGDVEAGISGGIVIVDRILPYINITTMRLSGIRIKPFFLRVTKAYE